MKDYRVYICIHKGWTSFTEAGTTEEAITQALEEWEDDLYGISREDLDITVEELYDEDIGV